MAKVKIVVSGVPIGQSFIVPYNHKDGLQHYPAGHAKAKQPVIYSIAKYEVEVVGGNKYHAVRFGLVNKGTLESTRVSDAGLSAERTTYPTWVPGYSPHSFAGSAYAGAWRLIPAKGFLIHEGADGRAGQVGGSLGCIEILDGGWAPFMEELKAKAKENWATIGAKQLLEVAIKRASSPIATLI